MPGPHSGSKGAGATGMQEADPLDAIESNRSLLDPQDAQIAMTRMDGTGLPEDASLGQLVEAWYTQVLGMDWSAPGKPQLQEFAMAQVGNANPLTKVQNIAQGNNMRPGAGAMAQGQLANLADSSQEAGLPPMEEMFS